MILVINYNKTLSDLQEKFNECFPHLKLEFYAHPHHWKESTGEQEHLDAATKLGALNLKNENGVLEIKSWYQIGRVEQDFSKFFGLNAQIFRHENGAWAQTSENDNLALKEQAATTNNLPSEEEADLEDEKIY